MKKLLFGAAFCLALGLTTSCDSQTGCWKIDVSYGGVSETFYFYGTREEAKTYVKAFKDESLDAKYKKVNKTESECDDANY